MTKPYFWKPDRTGPAGPTGSTGNQPSIRSNYGRKPKIAKKSVNSENRPVQPENWKPAWSNQLLTGLSFFVLSHLKLRRLTPNPKS